MIFILFDYFIDLISIIGYATIAVFLYYKSRNDERYSSLLGGWVLFLTVLLLARAIADIPKNEDAARISRIIYLVLLNIEYIICAILLTVFSNFLLIKLEDKLMSRNRNLLLYTFRLMLLGFSAVTILSAEFVTKSIFYDLEIAKYNFKGVDKLIEQEQSKEINSYEIKKHNLRSILLRINKVDQDTIYFNPQHILSRLTGTYEAKLQDSSDFRVEYEYTSPGKSSVESHILILFPKKDSDEGSIHLLISSTSRLKYIKTSKLKDIISGSISSTDLASSATKSKPQSLSAFAYASFMNTLGITAYTVEAKDSKTEQIDLIITWLFRVLTLIVFFEIIRKWNFKPK